MQDQETAVPVSIDCGTFSAEAPSQPTEKKPPIEPKVESFFRRILKWLRSFLV
jgi:hypothetical protein